MVELEYGNVFGNPPSDLVAIKVEARQFSPLIPGADRLSEQEPGSLDGFAMLAQPGTVERRYAIALALRALRPGAKLTVLAPKDKGGSRIAQDLRGFGCAFEESAKRHHRICESVGPGDSAAVTAAIAEGEPRRLEDIGLWSQPGIFSWNRIDPGSSLLLENLPVLGGRGADFGCGIGVLAASGSTVQPCSISRSVFRSLRNSQNA